MPVDVFLKIDGIPGETVDDKHKGEIDVVSFHWGLNNPARGPARPEDFTVVKAIDVASPSHLRRLLLGRHHQGGADHRRQGGRKGEEDYYKIRLEEVLIASLTPAAGRAATRSPWSRSASTSRGSDRVPPAEAGRQASRTGSRRAAVREGRQPGRSSGVRV